MENKTQIFPTTLITMGIELDHELAFDVYWLCVLRGSKSSPNIDTKMAQGWRWGGGVCETTLDIIELATYLTSTRIGNPWSTDNLNKKRGRVDFVEESRSCEVLEYLSSH